MRIRLIPDDPELGWTPYAYLVYSVVFVVKPIVAPQTPWERPASALALATFLALYFWAYWLSGKRILIPIAGLCALAVTLGPVNFGASTFFIYAGAFAAMVGTTRHAVLVILAILAVVGIAAWQVQPHPFFWLPAAIFTPLIGGLNIHQVTVRRANNALRRSQDEVTRLARVTERERIARDLHDLLGHTLTVITRKAELAARLVTRDPERAEAEVRSIEEVARQATREVRHAVTGYRQRSLDEEVAQARTALDATGIAFHCDVQSVALEPVQEGVLALALREAVTNVVRHAAARNCRVALSGDEHSIRLRIEDDGRGGDAPEGAGLTGMRERVTALGGRLERHDEDGTTLVIQLPRSEAHDLGAVRRDEQTPECCTTTEPRSAAMPEGVR